MMKIEQKKIYSKLRAAIVDLTEVLDETVSFGAYVAAGANGGSVRMNGGARLSNFHATEPSFDAPDVAAYNNAIAARAGETYDPNRFTEVRVS